MKTKLKQSLVLALTFVLLLANVPASVFAEGEQDNLPQETVTVPGGQTSNEKDESPDSDSPEQGSGSGEENNTDQTNQQKEEPSQDGKDEQAVTLPKATYRLHTLGFDKWTDDEGWLTFDEHQKKLEEAKDTENDKTEAPFDSLEIKFDDETLSGVEYRIRDEKGTWQEEWTKAPKAATNEAGITGVELRLANDTDAQFDLWYRAATADGTWLDWVRANKALESKDLASLYDFEILVTKKGEKPPVGNVAQEGNDDSSNTTDESTDETTDPSSNNESDETAGDAIKTQEDNAAQDTPKVEDADKKADSNATVTAEAASPEVEYRAHVQNIGWQGWVKNGALAGTSGRSLRVEGFYFHLNNASGDILCQAHVQNDGWQNWVTSNHLAGTQARSLRVEAIRLKLSGDISKTHDVYYRAHVQNIGWQDWVKNGASAGTSGRSLRVEAIEVMLVRKGGVVPFNKTDGTTNTKLANSTTPGVRYQAHVQNIGWQSEVKNGATAGTSGKSYRVEALRIATTGIDGGITYRMHVQNEGWQSWRSNGELGGTTGKSYRVEALQIELTGNAKSKFSVYYRAHVQNVGWMAWTKDGGYCGSSGRSLRMEAVQIKLVPQGSAAPSDSGSFPMAFLGDISVTYNMHAQGGSWLGNKSDGATGGTTGQSGRIDFINAKLSNASGSGIRYSVQSEAGNWQSWVSNGANAGQSGKNITAIRFELTGSAASYYDVWYRAHCANKGWLGWTRNGGEAGADSVQYPIEAYQVKVVPSGSAAPGSTVGPYYFSRQLNGVDVSGHNWGNGSSAQTLRLSEVEGDFFIIKATEGTLGTIYNTRYKQMAQQALNTGRLIGFYHYANGGDAIKEADTFYDAIKDYKGRAIACLDWEGYGNKLFDTGKDVAWCKQFLDRLKLRFGGTPLLYTSKSYTNSYNWSTVANSYPLWGAEYPNYDDINGYQTSPWQSSRKWGAWGTYPTIFQYTGTGVLKHNGGCSHFDFDLFYGSATDWRKLQG